MSKVTMQAGYGVKASAAYRSKTGSITKAGTSSKRVAKRAILPALIAGLMPNLALAEESGKHIEEVLVTTERRVQSLQDVSGTVQAFNAKDLTDLGVSTDFKNLQNVVTGLHISNQEGKLEVFLRGIGSSDSDFASDPSVATHYNGIYLPRPRSIGPMFFDVERVEVNKGPQGTLRGRNATGGTINIISKRPEMDELKGDVTLGLGSYDQQHGEATLNIPVNDSVAFRVAAFSETRDSYMTNATADLDVDVSDLDGQGERLADALGGDIEAPGSIDNQALRISALIEPNDQFSAYLMADRVWQGGSSVPGAFSGRSLSAGYDINDLDDPYNQYFVNEGGMDNDIFGASGVFTYHLNDNVSFEYNLSYREYDFVHRNAAREWQIGLDYPTVTDSDGNIIDGGKNIAEDVIFGNERTAYGNFTQTETSKTLINELRAFGETEKLVWSAGLFKFDEKFSGSSQDFSHGWWDYADSSDPTGPIVGWLNGLSSENRNDDSTVDSTAVYGDLTYALNDSLRIKGGLRYTQDEKVSNESNAQYKLILDGQSLLDYGLEGPYDIVMGTSGLELTGAGSRPINEVPLGNNEETKQYFLDGITSWGYKDNLGDFIAAYPDAFEVEISSDFENVLDEDNLPGNVTAKYDESYADWRIGAEYDVDSVSMAYGTISTGTRSGGVNRPFPGEPAGLPWEAEELLVYEVGYKTEFDLADLPVRLNSAAFYYDYKNKVVQSLVCKESVGGQPNDGGNCTNNVVVNQNAANASILGFELDGDILLPMDFRLRANFAYLDSEFKDAEILDTRQGDTPYVDISGNALPNTSKYNLNLALSQDKTVNWGAISSIDWTLSAAYRSEYSLSAYDNQGFDADGNEIPLVDMVPQTHWLISGAGFNEANGNFLKDDVPATTIVNFNAGVNMGADEQYRAELWVSNLTEEVYSTKAFINDSVNIRFLNSPRMAGVRFKAAF